MSEHEAARHLVVSWDEVHRQTSELAEHLNTKGPWKGIIAVTRNGLVSAAILSHQLGIRLVDTLCISSYDQKSRGELKLLKPAPPDDSGMLIIEDLVDTGRTAKVIRELYKKAYFTALFAKPLGKTYVDHFVTEVPQDTWVVFPWEPPLSLEEQVSYTEA